MRSPTRALPLSAVALLVAMGTAAAQQQIAVAGDELQDAARAVRASIAELKLDEAGAELAPIKADKTAEGKKLAKELAAEVLKAKRIARVAQQIERLLDEKKTREAESVADAALDSFPGAVALAAVKKLQRRAREAAFVVLGDFDEEALDPNWVASGQGASAELIDDDRGGHAVKWACVEKSDHVDLMRRCPDSLNLDDFEYATVRIRLPRKIRGEVFMRFLGWKAAVDYASVVVPVKPTTDWQTVTVQLTHLSKYGGFDRNAVPFVDFSYNGPESVEIDFDDVMMAKKRQP